MCKYMEVYSCLKTEQGQKEEKLLDVHRSPLVLGHLLLRYDSKEASHRYDIMLVLANPSISIWWYAAYRVTVWLSWKQRSRFTKPHQTDPHLPRPKPDLLLEMGLKLQDRKVMAENRNGVDV